MSSPDVSTFDVDQHIRNLVAEVLEKNPQEIGFKDSFVKDLGMDSMMALEILAGIEKKYHIIIPEDMMPKFVNLEVTGNIVKNILKENKKK